LSAQKKRLLSVLIGNGRARLRSCWKGGANGKDLFPILKQKPVAATTQTLNLIVFSLHVYPNPDPDELNDDGSCKE